MESSQEKGRRAFVLAYSGSVNSWLSWQGTALHLPRVFISFLYSCYSSGRSLPIANTA
jgi:hypothetical protein